MISYRVPKLYSGLCKFDLNTRTLSVPHDGRSGSLVGGSAAVPDVEC